jgi:hypothetical protein
MCWMRSVASNTTVIEPVRWAVERVEELPAALLVDLVGLVQEGLLVDDALVQAQVSSARPSVANGAVELAQGDGVVGGMGDGQGRLLGVDVHRRHVEADRLLETARNAELADAVRGQSRPGAEGDADPVAVDLGAQRERAAADAEVRPTRAAASKRASTARSAAARRGRRDRPAARARGRRRARGGCARRRSSRRRRRGPRPRTRRRSEFAWSGSALYQENVPWVPRRSGTHIADSSCPSTFSGGKVIGTRSTVALTPCSPSTCQKALLRAAARSGACRPASRQGPSFSTRPTVPAGWRRAPAGRCAGRGSGSRRCCGAHASTPVAKPDHATGDIAGVVVDSGRKPPSRRRAIEMRQLPSSSNGG